MAFAGKIFETGILKSEDISAVTMSNGNGSLPPPSSIVAIITPPAPFSTSVLPMATTSYDDMTVYEQTGSVILGPGSKKEAWMLGLGLPKLSHRQQDVLAKAKKFAMEQSIKHVLMKQAIAHQQQQQKMTMYAQALSLMGRVYVGSISFELREETIKNAFAPFGPLKSVNMSFDPMTGHHKGFAFLEYEVPEAATLAQEQMNNVLLGGRHLKVGRPSNMSQAQNIVEMIREEAKHFHRIYVSSIHPDLTEADVKSVFEAFGPIRSIEWAKASAGGKHRGYAYIDYDTEQAAVDAVASMNLFDLGGQYLRVGRAITPPSMRDYLPSGSSSTLPTASAVAAAAVTAKLQALEATKAATPSFAQQPQVIVSDGGSSPSNSAAGGPVFVIPPPGLAIPQAPTPSGSPSSGSIGSNSPALFPNEFQQSNVVNVAPQPVYANQIVSPNSVSMRTMSEQPSALYGSGMPQMATGASTTEAWRTDGKSRVIVLKNMVLPEEVDETLEDEVAEECSNFGRVDTVFVYHDQSNSAVKIFVKYAIVQEADLARSKLDGRYFSGRQIEAVFYDEKLFERNDYSK